MAKQKAAAPPRVTAVSAFVNPNTYKGPFRPVWCAEHHFTGPWPCSCPPGPQIMAWCGGRMPNDYGDEADEIGCGGTRGSGKTALILGWMAYKGNRKPMMEAVRAGKQPKPTDIAYYFHRNYRGLILRAQANDLGDLLDRAEEMYGPTGAVITRGNPAIAEWPHGGKIIFGHFGDNGWKKYIGQEYQRIMIDQAEMMESKEIHDRIMGSLRSKWPELKCQIMLAFNPGGGDVDSGAPGQGWLMDYFTIEAWERGTLKPGYLVKDEHGKLRTYVFSRYLDNPYLLHYAQHDAEGNLIDYKHGGGAYVKWLNSIEPESLRSAWRDGNFHALSGAFFREFRPNGPLYGEPANASHVYDPATVKLEPWFHRWMSIDWGYIHPTDVQFHCKSPWGQVYTYKEISLNRVEPVELGVLIAREAKKDLDGLESHHMNIFLSPDAFAKRESENTVASQLAVGINKVFGPGSAFVADLTETEREMRDPEQALRSMQSRRRDQRATLITILRANTDRVAGWMHMQTMLRWRPLQETSKPDTEFADRLYHEKGLVAYMDYMNSPEFKASDEVLPKWQISNECKWLIKCLPTLMHKPGTNDVMKRDATETQAGDDPADSARMALLSEELQKETAAPLEIRVAERVKKLQEAAPGMSMHSIVMASNHARYEETHQAKKKALPFHGHNRLAVRRELLAARQGKERTIV